MEDPRDPHVEPKHPHQAVGHTTESAEVPAAESGVSGVECEKQEDDKRERSSGGEADADGEDSGLGEEEEESSKSEEEEEDEDEQEQEDQTKIKSRLCILEGGDAEAQQVGKYIIARKYVHVSKLIWDEELKYGESRRVQRPRLARLRRSVAHRGLIEEVCGYLPDRGLTVLAYCVRPQKLFAPHVSSEVFYPLQACHIL